MNSLREFRFYFCKLNKCFPCQIRWLIRFHNLKILQGRRKESKNKLLFETIPFAKYATEN